MKKVADGVYQIGGYVNAFLIDGDEGVTLVDTGLPKKDGAVREALDAIGRTIENIDAIVITHGHADHFGCAKVLKASSGAALVASTVDAPVIRGDQPTPPPPFTDKYRFLKPILGMLPTPDGVVVDHEISGDDPVPLASDLSVVQTPGHTAGHISLLLDRHDGVLFVGDAATADRKGEVRRGFMNLQSETFDDSLRKLAGLEFSTALFGHSEAIAPDAASAFRRWVEDSL